MAYDDIVSIFNRPSPMAMALLGYHQATDLRNAKEDRERRIDQERFMQWYRQVQADQAQQELDIKAEKDRRALEMDQAVGPFTFQNQVIAPTIAERPVPGVEVTGDPYQGDWSISQPGAQGYGPAGYQAGGVGGRVFGGGYRGSGGADAAPVPPTLIGPDPAAIEAMMRLFPNARPDLAPAVERYKAQQQETGRKAQYEQARTHAAVAQAQKAERPTAERWDKVQDASGEWVYINRDTGEARPTGLQGKMPQEPTPHFSFMQGQDAQGMPVWIRGNTLTGAMLPAEPPDGMHPKQAGQAKPMTVLQRAELWKHYVGARTDDFINLPKTWKPNLEDFKVWQKEIGMDEGPAVPAGGLGAGGSLPQPQAAGGGVPSPPVAAPGKSPRIIRTARNAKTGQRLGLGEDGKWYALP